jgi:uncharacterized protein with HEPN domain
MRHRAIQLLEDIRQAGAAIQRLTRDRSESDYLCDEGLRLAVERAFEIIGEAMRRLVDMHPELAASLSQAHQIVGFRNVIAHGYDVLDDRRVWLVVQSNLPVLQRETDRLLAELNASKPSR